MNEKINLSFVERDVLLKAVPCNRSHALRADLAAYNPMVDNVDFMLYSVHVATSDDNKEIVTYMLGIDTRDRAVCVRFTGFHPYFYLAMPVGESDDWLAATMTSLYEMEPHLPKSNLKSVKIVYKKPFVGFIGNETRPYAKFKFKSVGSLYKYNDALQRMFPARTKYEPNDKNFIVKVCEARDTLEKVVWIFSMG